MKGKGFHLLHLNVRSLWPKIDLIRNMLNNNVNIAAFTLSESWLSDEMPNEMLEIDNFVLYGKDRDWRDNSGTIKKGGGIATYIKNDYNVSDYALQHLNESTQHGEFQWLLVKNNHCKNIVIANCYRPPSGNIDIFIKSIETKLSTIDRGKNDVFLTGDINIDLNNNVCNSTKLLKDRLL